MGQLAQRMLRAAKLDVSLYEEVEHDQGSLKQSMIVVVLASVAAGVGSLAIRGPQTLIFTTIAALIGWYVWAALIYLIGTKILPEEQTQADHGQLLRTIGFSSAPGVLRVLAALPGAGGLVFLVTGIWMLVAMVIAVRQALDYKSTWRAVGVCVIGWVIQGFVIAALLSLMNTTAGV